MVFIHPDDLIAKYSVEELIEFANEYFASIKDPSTQLAKPFNLTEESFPILGAFSSILDGMRLARDMVVLDLGCGTCWTSKFLIQLGCRVICCDVSESALELGRKLFELSPVIGKRHTPEFRLFDGHRIPASDGEVDRVLVFEAFHHIPNQMEVLSEIYRVLGKDGIAAFSEPGPRHSHSPGAQSEMARFKVIEGDIIIETIWKDAMEIGFQDIKLAILARPSIHLDIDEFQSFINGASSPHVETIIRDYMQDRLCFFLYKQRRQIMDSRYHEGLAGEIISSGEYKNGLLEIDLTVRNTGSAVWLSRPGQGQVNIGYHLLSPDGKLIDIDYRRKNLYYDVLPGKSISLTDSVPVKENSIIEVDLVAEYVTWFEAKGTQVARYVIGPEAK